MKKVYLAMHRYVYNCLLNIEENIPTFRNLFAGAVIIESADKKEVLSIWEFGDDEFISNKPCAFRLLKPCLSIHIEEKYLWLSQNEEDGSNIHAGKMYNNSFGLIVPEGFDKIELIFGKEEKLKDKCKECNGTGEIDTGFYVRKCMRCYEG